LRHRCLCAFILMFVLSCVQVVALRRADPRPKSPTDVKDQETEKDAKGCRATDRCIAPPFLTSAPDEGEWSIYRRATQATGWTQGVRFPERTRDFYLLQCLDRLWGSSNEHRGLLHREIKRQGHEATMEPYLHSRIRLHGVMLNQLCKLVTTPYQSL
jgi:hypothetical protein